MTKYDGIVSATLAAVVAVFFLWGIGYLITSDSDRIINFKKQCIENGMQYINGSCVK
jgi:hypothetical protein